MNLRPFSTLQPGDYIVVKPRPPRRETARGFDKRNLSPPSVSEAKPFEHQETAIAFLLKNRRCILADEPGCGKTLPAILAARGRTIVQCKASLKANWLHEIKTAFPTADVQIIGDKKPVAITCAQAACGSATAPATFVILTFGVAAAHAQAIVDAKPETAIVDEAHNLKNRKSQRFQSCKEIVWACQHRYLLTATPILNRPYELVGLLTLLGRLNSDFGGWEAFVTRYCGAYIFDDPNGDEHWDYSGSSRLDELHERLISQGVMLRRLKNDVLSLPNKTRHVIRVDVEPVDLAGYVAIEAELAREIAADRELLSCADFAFLAKARQAVGVLKIPAASKFIDEFLSMRPGKLIVFVHHKAVARALTERYPDALKLDASTRNRGAVVAAFQEGSARLIITSAAVGGEGVTLTAARTVLTVELDFNAARHLQAEDRAYRIGQTGDVDATYIFANGTVDGFLAAHINRKDWIFGKALDGLADADYLLKLGQKVRRKRPAGGLA